MGRYDLIKDFVKRHKWKYILGICFILGVDILQLIFPKLLGYITDELQKSNIDMKMISKYILFLLGIALGVMICRYLFRIFIFGTEKKLDYELRKKLFDHLLTLSPSFYNTHKTGDLMAHATNDVNAVRMAMGTGVLLSTDTLFLTISVLVIMFKTIDVKLTFMVLIPLLSIGILSIFFGKVVHKRFTAVQEAFSGLTDKVQETLSGIRVVKSFVQEEYEKANFEEVSTNAFDKNMKMAKLWGAALPFAQFVATISFIIMIGYGGIKVMYGDISLGDFIAFNTYLGMLVWPMMAFGWVISLIQRGLASLDRLNSIMCIKPEITDKEAGDIRKIQGHILFDNLTFSYMNDDKPVLKNINLDIPSGSTLAITGGTGSGKTTLVNLILRMYEGYISGNIYIDGHELKKIPLSALRRNIGYVPQDNFLFSSTLKENIAFGNIDASMEDIEQSTKIAQVYDDILSFPEGFDTIVGERGVTLSGGQKQRVSIARAIILDPKILIMDDALSAVDTQTEEIILNNLKNILAKRTSIIIAHRISTIENADNIIFLEGGEIVEQGTHEELLALKGKYYDLYQRQLLEEQVEEA
ncbi:MAG: ABC transporter ATP-binding protein/permease [Xylanivirga thermophila]|jgi:ATP-binding cassette, subfamily B, multidrug efflux pump|uniref:ABC transporter ATP-binding protein n=1 Tax=Xylanivirga thermophila TaxID=2496273 RepID=UPI00101C43EB|nr:ABC transporter ATP-binding protein [Xylanivirga thermophila]